MNRKLSTFVLIGIVVFLFSGTAFAAEEGSEVDKATFYITMVITCASAMAVTSCICGWAQSKAIQKAMDSISRQPSAAKDIQTILIIGLSLIEALGLYTLVVALVFVFTVKPF